MRIKSFLFLLPCVTLAGSTWVQQGTLAAPGNSGSQVAISGNTAVVSEGTNGAGMVFVYVRTGPSSAWVQQATLTPSDPVDGDEFGGSVAISGDTVVVGAPRHNQVYGAVYVFVRSGATWTQQQEFASTDKPFFFGQSVAISGDTILVGVGSRVYLFVRAGGTPASPWTQQQLLTPPEDGIPRSCCAISLSGDTLAIGAESGYAANSFGKAYVYVRNGGVANGSWTLQQQLLPSDSAINDGFGASVALSGNTILISAPHPLAGSAVVYAFVRNGTSWSQQAEFASSDLQKGDGFGNAVALNGNIALVGAPMAKPSHQGAAYVFVRVGTTWTQQQELLLTGGAVNDGFGDAVALANDTAVVGAFGNSPYSGPNTGAYPFVTVSAAAVNPNNGGGATQTFSALYSDPNGVTDIQSVYLSFSLGAHFAQQSCNLVYVRASNQLYLYNDTNSQILGPLTPGSAGSTSNNQCILATAGPVTTTATDLSLPVSITFKPQGSLSSNGFTGIKTIFGLAQAYSGANSDWQTLGTWTSGLEPVSISPSNGDGLGPQTFRAVLTDPVGPSDIQVVYVDFGTAIFGAHSCIVAYVPSGNGIYLFNDASNGATGPIMAGTSSTLSNSQCTVSGAGGTATASTWNLTTPFSITFAAGFTGAKSVWGLAQSYQGAQSPWQLLGIWTPAPAAPLGAVSVVPSSGSGLGPQTFTATYTDPMGASDLQVVYLDIGSTGGNYSCMVAYVPASNALYLFGDHGSAMGPITPGSSSSVSNSQCILSGQGGLPSSTGNNLTVPFSITFGAIGYGGQRPIYGLAQSYSGAQNGWQLLGNWTPN